MIALVRSAFIALFLMTSAASASDVRALAESLETKAMNGDVRSAYKLGLLFSDGQKLAPDYFSAKEWFQRAAEQGYVRAMLKLADIHLSGKGGKPNLSDAQYWFEAAAQAGSSEAMSKLGEFFAGKKEFDQSAYWYKKAAIKGRTEAMRELGRYYYKGIGVHFNLAEAFAWLELASKKGDYEAEALKRELMEKKGLVWADQIRHDLNHRMIPEEYWDAR